MITNSTATRRVPRLPSRASIASSDARHQSHARPKLWAWHPETYTPKNKNTPNLRDEIPQTRRARHRGPAHPSRSSTNGQGRDRTGDTRIFSPVLYQLSYLTRTAGGRFAGPLASSCLGIGGCRSRGNEENIGCRGECQNGARDVMERGVSCVAEPAPRLLRSSRGADDFVLLPLHGVDTMPAGEVRPCDTFSVRAQCCGAF
jgi:hypothetical protein